MKLNFFEKLIGSTLFSGYIPFASGTFSSLVALLVYGIPGIEKPPLLGALIIIFFITGVYISTKFEAVYGKDPSECTIDEVIGMWITLLFLPKTILISILAFFVWRIFDIIKPYPVRKLENLKAGWGVMLDDVVAGIYSLALMHLILFLSTVKF
ncbi:MAG: phosphatidylglycerophosphatase A [Ignavibacteriaceae bacterium]